MSVSIDALNDFLKKSYEGSTWSLSRSDMDAYHSRLSTLTYGEIKESSVELILDWLQLDENDVVYDLGCGLGRFVAHIYLRSKARAVYGVELAESRYRQAQRMLTVLKEIPDVHEGREIEVIRGDIAEVNCADATVIYMCSTCFSVALLNEIAANLQAQADIGLRVLTLKRFPTPGRFRLLAQREMEMTWSDNSTVYLYQLETEPPAPAHSVLPEAGQSLLLSDEDSWDSVEIDIDSFDWDDDSEA